MTPARRVRALAIHAGYRCRHALACCTSGWAIPVEPETEERLRAALRSGSLRPAEPDGTPLAQDGGHPPEGLTSESGSWSRHLRTATGLPHGARAILRTDGAGRCVFLDPRGGRSGPCAVHRDLGEEALPSSCRHFPRVVTLTPLGVSVTLSHYCPTAAGMLFVTSGEGESAGPARTRDSSLRIVESPEAFPAEWPWEGLDARDAVPPLLRPGVLMDWPSLERWERFSVSVLAGEGLGPEEALEVLASAAEDARGWKPGDGAFDAFLKGVLEGAATRRTEGEGTAFQGPLRNGLDSPRDPAGSASRAWRLVAGCVPRGAAPPSAPDGLGEAAEQGVALAWSALSLPIRRWLAAKAFASWLALQGEGLRTTVLGLRVALGVLRAEAARAGADAGRALDPDLLKEAIRAADLLLVHLADPEALARRLSRCEAQTLDVSVLVI